MPDDTVRPTHASRRTVLRTVSAGAGAVALGTGIGTAQARITRRIVIPFVPEFEGSYRGQFVFVDTPNDEPTTEVPTDDCAFPEGWPPDESATYDGQLLDRRQERPLAVDLTVYTNGDKADIEPGTYFIIQQPDPCPGDWIGLEAESVPRRSLAGKDPGPTVTPTEPPGFGVLAALGGAGAAAVIRALRARRAG